MGFRHALQRLGGSCRYSVEWDKYCQKTYREWYGETPKGNITKIKPSEIPDCDILGAGFPCQPFSIAGVSKKNSLGHAHGFECVNQGNLFFTLATIIEEKRPPIIFLENVKNLRSHDSGNTWKVIEKKLKTLDYDIHAQVIDAGGWVPQHRERIYIVGFDKQFSARRWTSRFRRRRMGRSRSCATSLTRSRIRSTRSPITCGTTFRIREEAQGSGKRFRLRPRESRRCDAHALGPLL